MKIAKSASPGVVCQPSHLQRCYVPKDPLDPVTLHDIRRIGRNVASIREWQNFTQEQLRDASGVSYRQIQRIESGQDDIALSFYIRIARALTVPLDWLFTEDWPERIDGTSTPHPPG
jgi:DNA-binding XRE family transcriptional regulator